MPSSWYKSEWMINQVKWSAKSAQWEAAEWITAGPKAVEQTDRVRVSNA